MKKILFIEDDLVTQKVVQGALGQEFQVLSCTTLAQANALLDESPDISAVLVDRGLPDGDGLSICQRLRQDNRWSDLPILFLSAAGSETDKVGAFYAGADDYVTKPFGLMELRARLQARLKKASTRIAIGDLEIDLDTHRALCRAGQQPGEIDLTRTEFKILATLMQSIDQVFTRERLMAKVWGDRTNVGDRVVDSHVSHLRRKIAHTGLNVESLRGEGYRLVSMRNAS